MYIKYTLSSQRHNFTTFLPAEIILLLLRQSSHILASEYENDTLCTKISNEGSDEPVHLHRLVQTFNARTCII